MLWFRPRLTITCCWLALAISWPAPAHAHAVTSKVVWYRPGLMAQMAAKNGVDGLSPDGCYLSTPLSNVIGSRWRVTLVRSAKHKQPVRTVECVQADVSQPHHRAWQVRDRRLFETSKAMAVYLCGFAGAPAECVVTITPLEE